MGSVVGIWHGPMTEPHGAARQWLSAGLQENATHVLVDVENAEHLVASVKADLTWSEALVQNVRGVAELFVCPRCLREHYVNVIQALRSKFFELDRAMNAHMRREAAKPPPQRAAEAAYAAFTSSAAATAAATAYRHFQEKYETRKKKGWRETGLGAMRDEKHDLKEALEAAQASDAARKAALLTALEAERAAEFERAKARPSFAELLRLEKCDKLMGALVEVTSLGHKTVGRGHKCIHGGRKECPDVGFTARGKGAQACALLAKLVN